MQPPPGAAALGLSGSYSIVRRFEFSAEKQRNVVVVRKPDGSLHVMAKGSPEMMRKLAGARVQWECGWNGVGCGPSGPLPDTGAEQAVWSAWLPRVHSGC